MKDSTLLDIPAPAIPGASFRLVEGHDAISQVMAEIGKGRQNRWPHHTASLVGMIGAARFAPDGEILTHQVGEISYAGAGNLVLSDLPEFKRSVVERVARAWRNGFLRLQAVNAGGAGADLVLQVPLACSVIGTAQACACGFLDRPERECVCTEQARTRWQARIEHAINCFRGVTS